VKKNTRTLESFLVRCEITAEIAEVMQYQTLCNLVYT